MRVLLAEPDPDAGRRLVEVLEPLGLEPVPVANGPAALECLWRSDGPSLAPLNWRLAELDGLTVCRTIRAARPGRLVYLILLLPGGGTQDEIAAALEAGADDFLLEPWRPVDVRARAGVGMRLIGLHQALAERGRELEQLLGRLDALQGLLPVCTYCRRIRDEGSRWWTVEEYVANRGEPNLTHGICPACYQNVVEPEIRRMEH